MQNGMSYSLRRQNQQFVECNAIKTKKNHDKVDFQSENLSDFLPSAIMFLNIIHLFIFCWLCYFFQFKFKAVFCLI